MIFKWKLVFVVQFIENHILSSEGPVMSNLNKFPTIGQFLYLKVTLYRANQDLKHCLWGIYKG